MKSKIIGFAVLLIFCIPIFSLKNQNSVIKTKSTLFIDTTNFYEEINCDRRNIVTICYELGFHGIDSIMSVSVEISSDSGITWTVRIDSIWDFDGDLGDSVTPGIHCFYWEMGFDMPNIESRNCLIKVTTQFYSLEGIYICDQVNDRIVRINDMTGAGWQEYRVPGGAPDGIYVDKDNRIYFTLAGMNLLYRIDDMSGTGLVSFGGLPPRFMVNPQDIDFDSLNRIYIADWRNDRIVRFNDMSGTGWVTYDGGGIYNDIDGIAIDDSQHIYFSDELNHRIGRIIDMSGSGLILYGTPGSGIGGFSFPYDIDIDSKGRIYIADWGNNRIVRINDMTGSGWVDLHSFGPITLSTPSYIDIGPDGKIYLTDSGNDRIIRINDMTGSGWVTFGTSGSGIGQFRGPVGIDAHYVCSTLVITNLAPLDSRPPRVSISCPETTIYFDDTVIISWHVEDLFWKSDSCSIKINVCGRETSFIVADTTFEFIMPESSLCDSAVFIVAARDSFCNWGYDTCILRFIPEEPTGYIAISFGDTISHPCRNVVVPLLVDSADCNIDNLVITFNVDTEVVHPLRFVPTIHPRPDSVKMIYTGTNWRISFFWSTRVRVSSGIAGFLHLNVDCATNAGHFSIIDIISAFAHRASALWRDGTVIVNYKINPWLTTIHFRDIASDMTAEVTFGASYTATDFYDPWIDLLHLTPPPGRIDVWLDIDDPAHPAVRKLFRDIRDMVPENVWTIIINHPSSTLVHWSPASLGEGFYTLNGWLDMRTDTQYFATPYETLNISWRLPRLRLDTIRILSGWNIISLPLRSPRPSADFIFRGTYAGPYEFDPIGATFFIPEIARIGVGYCINSPVDTNIIFVGTIYNRYQRYVYRGWNILGCPTSAVDTTDITTSGTRILNIFEFDEASRCYVIPDSLRPGKGYWFLMSNNGKIYVPR